MKSTKNVAIRLENTTPGHSKFWSVVLNSRKVRCFWGKIGVWSQSKKFVFDSNDEALEFVQKKLDSKMRRGYINVTLGGSSAISYVF